MTSVDTAQPNTRSVLPIDLYQRLRELARKLMRGEDTSHTLQATALVHEAWMRIAHSTHVTASTAESRQHLLAAASDAMRHTLIDHARGRRRAKRGNGRERKLLDLADVPDIVAADSDEIVALDAAFATLSVVDPDSADVVRMRFHLGLGVDETAVALGISQRTVKRRFAFARSWLFRELQRGGHVD